MEPFQRQPAVQSGNVSPYEIIFRLVIVRVYGTTLNVNAEHTDRTVLS
jgi:hypothetical protein